jgi:hypothetical protein
MNINNSPRIVGLIVYSSSTAISMYNMGKARASADSAQWTLDPKADKSGRDLAGRRTRAERNSPAFADNVGLA